MAGEEIREIYLKIQRDVAAHIREDGFFSIMVDETTDQSNREQVVIVIRHVDSDLNVQKQFIGLCMVPLIDAATLTSVILDTLVRKNISLSKCRGQCYDGASNMSGAKKGVAANITKQEPRAIYTHCYGHAINLAVGDTVKRSKVMRDSLDTVFEMSKIIKYSPRRDTILEQLKREMALDTSGFRVLCPTRWTVRALSLNSVLENYYVALRILKFVLELSVLRPRCKVLTSSLVCPLDTKFYATQTISIEPCRRRTSQLQKVNTLQSSP